ncbi:hypothetical protein DSL72_005604 [Monilinia vaccinii-corymbosi]|uniref:Glycoside hydrolase family 5 domain-containing protein n=1 Tax=Monilinia vaccinii-corymbosi TaxID=61207 RepID=A0A8A3PG58_9HELO|nr:hypothetical protein DSL72_005604 [Monilinia vaccinii-corymbosi]
MYFSKALLLLSPLLTSTLASAIQERASWPYFPLKASGRWILDSAGHNVSYAGVNWPGAADTMLPEGLQYQSIATIVSKIKSLGMNVIRLTYAIQMIDEYYANGEVDVSISTALTNALGTVNGSAVLSKILQNNPSFTTKTTRMEVFDAVAAECFKQKIYVHLDNHISKGTWCCSTTDGNAWFGDKYFDVENWKRGISYMATRGSKWGNLMSVSLRNELRQPSDDATLTANSYNWANWYTNMVAGMESIHAANPDVLIFLSGLNFDVDLSPIANADLLTPSTTQRFLKSDFSYANKLVLELHNYATGTNSCSDLKSSLKSAGYNALDPGVKNQMPVVMTEWGHSQTTAAYASVYSTCLKSYLNEIKGGWMVWVLSGSYYIRSGTQDYEETWGLLSHDWSQWRDPNSVKSVIIPMVSGSKIWSP